MAANNGKDWSAPANFSGDRRPTQRRNQPVSRLAVPDGRPSIPQTSPTAPSGYYRPSNLNMSDMERNRGYRVQ